MKKLSNFAQISLKVRSWVPDSFGRFGSSPNRNPRFEPNRRRIGGLTVIRGTPSFGYFPPIIRPVLTFVSFSDEFDLKLAKILSCFWGI